MLIVDDNCASNIIPCLSTVIVMSYLLHSPFAIAIAPLTGPVGIMDGMTIFKGGFLSDI